MNSPCPVASVTTASTEHPKFVPGSGRSIPDGFVAPPLQATACAIVAPRHPGASPRTRHELPALGTSPRRGLARGGVAFVIALLGLASPACDEVSGDSACSEIPPGGCPLSRGVACEDPSCEAVYACRPGNVWEFDRTCPPRDAGALRDGATDVSPVAARDAAVDAPPGASGGPGCGLLQVPDCALGSAQVCPSGCCDCEDLFVCLNGGWAPWGTCSDGAIREF